MAVPLQPSRIPFKLSFPAESPSTSSFLSPLSLFTPLNSGRISSNASAIADSRFSDRSPVFLSHLEQKAETGEEEDLEEKDHMLELQSEGKILDPLRSFFESKGAIPDPAQEGRTLLQKNRRTSWRISNDLDLNLNEYLEEVNLDLNAEADIITTPEENGVVGEILGIARKIPPNFTLGEILVPFEGKVEEGDCIYLLERMGKEGLILECLYFFEWMRLQKPSLVTPRSCSVLFPVLGRAGKGKELITLFNNLPKSKRFRDVHVYNSAISGLASSGR